MSLRQCFREPIPEIEIVAGQLSDAVAAHLRGDRETAEGLFRLADNKTVREWVVSISSANNDCNRPLRVLANHPTIKDVKQRAQPSKADAATRTLIHQRDGHYCRFCHMPVIRADVRKEMHNAYESAVRWGGTDPEQHFGFQCLWAQYDHIIPWSRGGRSDLENVYLTCYACNYGRNRWLLEEVGIAHPSLHAPRQGSWDGIETFR